MLSRDLAFIGASIMILSVLFNIFTQNLVITALVTKAGAPFGEQAGRISRSTTYDQFGPGFTFTGELYVSSKTIRFNLM